jgi:hypothetical protein
MLVRKHQILSIRKNNASSKFFQKDLPSKMQLNTSHPATRCFGSKVRFGTVCIVDPASDPLIDLALLDPAPYWDCRSGSISNKHIGCELSWEICTDSQKGGHLMVDAGIYNNSLAVRELWATPLVADSGQRIRDVYPGSGFFLHPGSRGQKSTGIPIRIRKTSCSL